jgi:hypothetical protein
MGKSRFQSSSETLCDSNNAQADCVEQSMMLEREEYGMKVSLRRRLKEEQKSQKRSRLGARGKYSKR